MVTLRGCLISGWSNQTPEAWRPRLEIDQDGGYFVSTPRKAAKEIPDAAAVGLQVNEVGFNGPTRIGWLVAEEQEALVDFNIVLAFDVGGFKLVHGLGVQRVTK